MKSVVETKSVKVFTTTDGKTFDDKVLAVAHQAELALVSWYESDVDHDTAVKIVETIKGDLDGYREIAAPLLRKPRKKKAAAPAADTPAKPGRAA